MSKVGQIIKEKRLNLHDNKGGGGKGWRFGRNNFKMGKW